MCGWGLGILTVFVDGTSVEDQGFTEKLMATIVNNIQVSDTETCGGISSTK